jgi:hypothetical protein
MVLVWLGEVLLVVVVIFPSKCSTVCTHHLILISPQQVFFPADMQLQCKPEPYAYRVCLRTIRIAEDIVDDPHFSGYMQIIIRGVPPVTDKADNEVMANDLKTWVLYGLKEEHPQVSGRK